MGDVADGAAIDTSTPGPHSFSVTATDRAGNDATETMSYSVTRTPDHTPAKREFRVEG